MTIRLWDVKEQKEIAILEGHKSGVSSVAVSRNGKWLASGSYDGTVLLWEVNLPSPYPVKSKGKQLVTWGRVKRTMLYQNYPNPFNPETWIPYQLREPADVAIRIYNAQGRLMRTINLGRREAGLYLNRNSAVYWDGRNDAGEKVASGIYFYQIKAGDFSAMRRMVMVK